MRAELHGEYSLDKLLEKCSTKSGTTDYRKQKRRKLKYQTGDAPIGGEKRAETGNKRGKRGDPGKSRFPQQHESRGKTTRGTGNTGALGVSLERVSN